MPRETCKDCSGPREPDSYYASYCKGCGNKRQRENYAKTAALAGRTVTPRVDVTNRRRARVIAGTAKPGPCDICNEYSPRLSTIVLTTDRTLQATDPSLPAELHGLACVTCLSLSYVMTSSTLHRAAQLHQYLLKQRHAEGSQPPLQPGSPVTVEQIVYDPNATMWGTVIPTPINLTGNSNEQIAHK